MLCFYFNLIQFETEPEPSLAAVLRTPFIVGLTDAHNSVLFGHFLLILKSALLPILFSPILHLELFSGQLLKAPY